MSSINNGNQSITYDYKQSIVSKDFNRLNYRLHPQGIYEGGSILKVNDLQIEVLNFVCLYEDLVNEVSVRIQTTDYAVVSVSPSQPYIVGRFEWLNSEDNYMDIVAVANTDIQNTDIIFGRLQFTGSLLSPDADYSGKTWVSKKELKVFEVFPFRVTPTYPNTNTIKVGIGGPYIVDNKRVELVTEQTSGAINAVVNGRKDYVAINVSTGLVEILPGVDSITPTVPVVSRGYLPVAILHLPSGATTVKGGYIEYIHPLRFKSNNISNQNVKDIILSLDGDASGLDGYALDDYSHTSIKQFIDVLNSYKWSKGSTNPFDFQAIAYGNNVFVALKAVSTSTGAVAVSSDYGQNWVVGNLPSAGSGNYWNSITFGNGTFVAVATTSSVVARSTDGVNWLTSSLPSSAYSWYISYGDGVFLVTGNNTTIAAVSTNNGETWAQVAMPTTSNWKTVSYGNGVFTAIAYNSSIVATSSNGVTWSQTSMPSSQNWNCLAFGNGVFVALATGTAISATSSNGVSWTQRTLPTTGFWGEIVFGNGLFFSVSTSTSTLSIFSSNGINWTVITLPVSENWDSLAYGNGTFIAGSNTAYATISPIII